MSDDVKKAKDDLVEALEACPKLATADGRNDCIKRLLKPIRSRVADHTDQRSHLTNIVDICLNYEKGIESLVEAVNFFEQGSKPMKRVRKCTNNLKCLMDSGDSILSKKDIEFSFLDAIREELVRLKPEDHATIRSDLKDFIENEIKKEEYEKRRDFYDIFREKAHKWPRGDATNAIKACQKIIKEYDRCIESPIGPYGDLWVTCTEDSVPASAREVQINPDVPRPTQKTPPMEGDEYTSYENKISEIGRPRISAVLPTKPLGRRRLSPEDSKYILENLWNPSYGVEYKRLHFILKNPNGLSIDDYQEWLLSAKPEVEKTQWDMVLRDVGKRFMDRWKKAEPVKKLRLSKEDIMYVLEDIWNPIYGPEARSLYDILIRDEGCYYADFEAWYRSARPEGDMMKWKIIGQKLKERFEERWKNAKPVKPPTVSYLRREV